MKAYIYNREDNTYIGAIDADMDPVQKGRYILPMYATFKEPPKFEKPFIPVWKDDNWELMEDHRKHLTEKGDYEGGTPYWMPGDTYQSEARYMKELGPLPEGATLSKPEKTQIEIRKEELSQQISEAKSFLSSTDYVSIKILEEPETANSYTDILEKRKAVRASIDPLQSELDSLERKS